MPIGFVWMLEGANRVGGGETEILIGVSGEVGPDTSSTQVHELTIWNDDPFWRRFLRCIPHDDFYER
jgi:hypothetical protein